MNEQRVRDAVEVLLAEVGEDPTREGLARTPDRVASALRFLTSGYDTVLTVFIGILVVSILLFLAMGRYPDQR